jgi:signal transduction histidine kinase
VNQNQLFFQTKWRLTTWYAGILTMILSLSGLGVYEAIAHAHRITISQELKTVSNTIHDSLQSLLQQPAIFTSEAINIVPNLCLINNNNNCLHHNQSHHLLGAINQEKYYFQFFDLDSNLIAIAGIQPQGLKINYSQEELIYLKDIKGIRYRQITIELHTKNGQSWGYIQVGRNLQDFDDYVKNVKLLILLILPIIIIVVMLGSWYLAQKAMQPIYQSYQQIQQFTADAAHELRTPLAAIRATIESSLISKDFTIIEARDTLETINKQNQRFSQLVADLLMLSRLDQGLEINNKISQNLVNINDLVDDIYEEFYALAHSQQINLIKQIEFTQSLEVRGSEEQLYRLVANLVINAINYTEKKGQVILNLNKKNNQIIIKIIDTGIGIPETEQKLIFNRFYRVNKARSISKNGAGLGLSIAQAIAIAHQGKIEVKSELGKGSIFSIILPIIVT